MTTISAVQGDITARRVDAIVNAANEQLARGSGVCGAIFAAAGTPRLTAACDEIGHCATGDAVVTPGFDLDAAWVIHTVGPVWNGGAAGERDLLSSCYRQVLAEADRVGARTVAFPAISTGVYGYPADEAALVAVETVTNTDSDVERVELVAFDDATFGRYRYLLRPNGGGASRASVR